MKMRAAAAAFALAAAVAFSTPPSLAQESKESTFTKIPTVKGIETLKPGTKAPDFKVLDLKGKEFHLASCCGKDAVLLFFWSFFCGPCREEIPMINQMAQEYRGKGLQVLGVNLDGREMKKAIDKFVASEKISFRILFDELEHPPAKRLDRLFEIVAHRVVLPVDGLFVRKVLEPVWRRPVLQV